MAMNGNGKTLQDCLLENTKAGAPADGVLLDFTSFFSFFLKRQSKSLTPRILSLLLLPVSRMARTRH